MNIKNATAFYGDRNTQNGMCESLQNGGIFSFLQNLEKAQRRVRASAAASVPGLVRGSDGPEPIKPGSIEDLE